MVDGTGVEFFFFFAWGCCAEDLVFGVVGLWVGRFKGGAWVEVTQGNSHQVLSYLSFASAYQLSVRDISEYEQVAVGTCVIRGCVLRDFSPFLGSRLGGGWTLERQRTNHPAALLSRCECKISVRSKCLTFGWAPVRRRSPAGSPAAGGSYSGMRHMRLVDTVHIRSGSGR